MFYLPQSPMLLESGYDTIIHWKQTKVDFNKIIPIIIPIHKNTTHTKMPTQFTLDTIHLLKENGIDNFFIYRPYALSNDDMQIFQIKPFTKNDNETANKSAYKKMCFPNTEYKDCIFDM